MLIRLTARGVAQGVLAAITFAALTFGQAAPQKQWKDQAEFELVVNGINKEANPQKKLQLIRQWEEKYPTSDFKIERLGAKLQAAQQAQDGPAAREAARGLIADGPPIVQMQMRSMMVQFGLADKNDAGWNEAEANAKAMLANIDSVFATKPAEITDEDWKKQKVAFEQFALKSLGDIHFAKKDFVKAEEAYAEALKKYPNQATVSQLLASSIVSQRKPERQPIALYHYARSAVLEGEGALAPGPKDQTLAFVKKNYVTYHGSEEGLPEILARAKTEAFPPADFKITNRFEEEAKNLDKLKESNPMMYRWVMLKQGLTGAEAENFFNSGVKESNAGGTYKGKLISQSPETKPKELVLSVSDGLTPDLTIKLEEPLPGRAEPGTELEIEGIVMAYQKEPFMLTMEADVDKIQGWPVKAAPSAKKAAGGAKKAAPAAKAKKK